MTVFKEKDIENMKAWGNLKAKSYWLASYSKTLYPLPGTKEKEKMKDFLKAKYVDKRFCNKSGERNESDEDSKDSSDEEERNEK